MINKSYKIFFDFVRHHGFIFLFIVISLLFVCGCPILNVFKNYADALLLDDMIQEYLDSNQSNNQEDGSANSIYEEGMDNHPLSYRQVEEPKVNQNNDNAILKSNDEASTITYYNPIENKYISNGYEVHIDNYLTPMRDQGNFGTCWCFSVLEAISININKNHNIYRPLSVSHLAYNLYEKEGREALSDPMGLITNCYNRPVYYSFNYDYNNYNLNLDVGGSDNYLDYGGNTIFTKWGLASWIGPVDDEVASYSNIVSDYSKQVIPGHRPNPGITKHLLGYCLRGVVLDFSWFDSIYYRGLDESKFSHNYRSSSTEPFDNDGKGRFKVFREEEFLQDIEDTSVYHSDDDYIPSYDDKDGAIHVQNIDYFGGYSDNETNRNKVKKLIMEKGSVATSYFHDSSCYNGTYQTFFTKTYGSNHAVSIVGWDDNIDKSLFRARDGSSPAINGGWLIRNSWHNTSSYTYGVNDYFWISYDDYSQSSFYGIDAEIRDEKNNVNYARNYQYDGNASDASTAAYGAANIFTAQEHDEAHKDKIEKLDAVSIGTVSPNTIWNVDIYKGFPEGDITDPTAGSQHFKSTTAANIEYAGYHTIKLKDVGLKNASNNIACDNVLLYPGERFAVVLTSASNSKYNISYQYDGAASSWLTSFADGGFNRSFVFDAGTNSWKDVNSVISSSSKPTMRVKAFTNFYEGSFDGIKIINPADKTKYYEWEELNTSGIKIGAFYDGDTYNYVDVTDKCTFDPTLISPSTNKISVYFNDGDDYASSYFNIEVLENPIDRIEVTKQPDKVKYFVGDVFDPTGMEVTAYFKYGNNFSRILEEDEYTIRNTDMIRHGSHTVTLFSNKDSSKIASVSVFVDQKEIKSIRVKEKPTKTDYIVGDKFDPTGLVLTLIFIDDNTEDVAEEYTYEPESFSESGYIDVTITYHGVSTSLTVYVERIKATKLEVTKKPDKMEYIVGQSFDKTGMIVTATFNNGTISEVFSYTWDPEKFTSVGTSVGVSVYFDGISANPFYVKVIERVVVSIEVTNPPNIKNYVCGQSFNNEGMVISALFNDGSKEEVNDYTWEPSKFSEAGDDVAVKIKYKDSFSCITKVSVVPRVIKSINVTKSPDKTEYVCGQDFDSTGMEVTATFNDETQETVSGFTWTPKTFTYVGDNVPVSVYYSGFQDVINVKVIPKVVDLISIVKSPTKRNYIVGQHFDPSGMVVRAHYNDGSYQDVTGYNWSPQVFDTVGDNIKVEISYEGKTAELEVSVIEKIIVKIAVSAPPTKTSYVVGQSFNPAGMVITAYYNDDSQAELKDYSYTPEIFNYANDKYPVIIHHEDLTASLTVKVEPKTLKSIYISKDPDKKTYIIGQQFKPDGMIVKGNYNDGTSSVIESGYTWDPTVFNKAGTGIPVHISYKSCTATTFVDVEKDSVTEIKMTKPPNKTTYYVGQDFDRSGMEITAIYKSGRKAVVDNYSYSPSTFTKSSNSFPVYITYEGKSIKLNLVVKVDTLASIYISNSPEKTQYYEGDKFVPNGMEVTAKYASGKEKVVNNYKYDNNPLETNNHFTTVSYSEGGYTKSTYQEINVKRNYSISYILPDGAVQNDNNPAFFNPTMSNLSLYNPWLENHVFLGWLDTSSCEVDESNGIRATSVDSSLEKDITYTAIFALADGVTDTVIPIRKANDSFYSIKAYGKLDLSLSDSDSFDLAFSEIAPNSEQWNNNTSIINLRYDYLSMFNVSLNINGVQIHNDFGTLNLEFSLDNNHEGSTCSLFHIHQDNKCTFSNCIVKDNLIKTNVKDLSDFAIGFLSPAALESLNKFAIGNLGKNSGLVPDNEAIAGEVNPNNSVDNSSSEPNSSLHTMDILYMFLAWIICILFVYAIITFVVYLKKSI